MRANGLSDSTIYAGEQYVMPSSADYAASTGEMGQAALNQDNARIAAQTSSYDSLLLGDYGLSASGLAVGPQDLYAMRPVSERLGSGEPMTTPSALEQAGEGAYNKLQAQWDSANSAAVNAWQQISTDPIGTLMQGTGAVLSFAANAAYDTALYASDQIAVSANLLSGGLIPATDALQRNVERTESVFNGVYNIEQAVDSKDYALAGGLAVAGFENALVSLITRGRGGQIVDGLTELDPRIVRTTQTTTKQQGAKLRALTESMQKNGFVVEPDRLIDVVRMPDGGLTSLDNTRIVAADLAGVKIQARVHNFDDLLPNDDQFISRFIGRKGEVPANWGDAVQNRISIQSSLFRNTYPQGSPFISFGKNY